MASIPTCARCRCALRFGPGEAGQVQKIRPSEPFAVAGVLRSPSEGLEAPAGYITLAFRGRRRTCGLRWMHRGQLHRCGPPLGGLPPDRTQVTECRDVPPSAKVLQTPSRIVHWYSFFRSSGPWLRGPSSRRWSRPAGISPLDVQDTVRTIVRAVREKGDAARSSSRRASTGADLARRVCASRQKS